MSEHDNGWLRVALAWLGVVLGDFLDHLTIGALVQVAVLILTVMQIVVTWRRLNRNAQDDREKL